MPLLGYEFLIVSFVDLSVPDYSLLVDGGILGYFLEKDDGDLVDLSV